MNHLALFVWTMRDLVSCIIIVAALVYVLIMTIIEGVKDFWRWLVRPKKTKEGK